jgi:hypothetical protein
VYGNLAPILRMRALCRAVAIACTAAFLFVGFAHSLQHCDATAAGYGATFAASGDAPDSSDDASPVAGYHCHGCVMVATTSTARSAALTLVPLRPLAVPRADARPHPPLAETPPPKSTT